MVPRWLHITALVTVLGAVPLIFLGAEVTTMGVGMVDERGFRAPWYFFQEFLRDRGLGWLVEHGHRLAGFAVGLGSIVLAAGLWFGAKRHWTRWLGVACLGVVGLQGGLGILRIEQNVALGGTLKMVHGWFAQLVFALLVVTAAATARGGMRFDQRRGADAALRRWSLLLCMAIYAQLVLGGLVRHTDQALVARAHMLGAFAVVALTAWLVKMVLDGFRTPLAPREDRPLAEREEYKKSPALRRWSWVLAGLVVVQLWLGVESWLSKFFIPEAPWNQLQPLAVHRDLVRSIHYVTGTLIFATSVLTALWARGLYAESPAERTTNEPAGRTLEGVA